MNRAGRVVGPLAGLLLGLAGLLLVARIWLQKLFEGLGPAKSADVALIVASTSCGAFLCALGAFLTVSAVVIRLQRAPSTGTSVRAALEPDPDRPARLTRLPAGNWAGDGNVAQLRAPRDAIELDFAGRPAVLVSRSAFYDALRMPRLRRADWRHDVNAYQSIRAYLIERGAVDNKGIWNSERREAIRRMAE